MTSWPPLRGVGQQLKNLIRHLCGLNRVRGPLGSGGLPCPSASLSQGAPCSTPSPADGLLDSYGHYLAGVYPTQALLWAPTL